MRYSYHIWMLIIPLITKTDVKFMMLHNMVKGETRDTFTLRFINNPYNAFDQLDLGYRPRLYQIGAEGEENYNQINVRQVPSGENVADEIFEDVAGEYWIFKEWIYLFGRNMENEDLLYIWEPGKSCGDKELLVVHVTDAGLAKNATGRQ